MPEVKPTLAPLPTSTPTPAPTLSAGEKKVQEMLKKSRERLKAYREGKQIEAEEKSSQKEDRAQILRDQYNKRAQGRREAFSAKAQELRDRWKKKRDEFLGHVDDYKKQTYKLEDLIQVGSAGTPVQYKGKSLIPKGSTHSLTGPENVIAGALDLEVKDQGKRPTCAAFAAVRALEVLDLKSKRSSPRQFSEQFFYYASKPQCQSSPCEGKGSWVTNGLDYLKKNPIPTEDQCPYSESSVSGNQTQIPLNSNCFQGERLDISYRNLQSLDQLAGEVSKQRPVIIGVRLTPSFYQTTGLVLESQNSVIGQMNEHAQGHALVIVGMIPLPDDVKMKEGNYCYIVANSWGEGWGVGGHACLSRKWLEHQLVPRALVSVERI